MAYSITVRSGHPKGIFRRDGRSFSDVPTVLEELTPGLAKEHQKGDLSWLVIRELKGEKLQKAQTESDQERQRLDGLIEMLQVDFSAAVQEFTYTQLQEAARHLGIELPGKRLSKAWIAENIKERLQDV